jgi:hypothetical protein
MFKKKEEQSSADFWEEYEKNTGEKVLARGLGKYISGWDEFTEKNWKGLWGLLITTSCGFRFLHFPQNSWMDALIPRKEPPKEKSFFLPKEKIMSTEFIVEKNWLKKIFTPSPPYLVIKYTGDNGTEKKLVFEAEYREA